MLLLLPLFKVSFRSESRNPTHPWFPSVHHKNPIFLKFLESIFSGDHNHSVRRRDSTQIREVLGLSCRRQRCWPRLNGISTVSVLYRRGDPNFLGWAPSGIGSFFLVFSGQSWPSTIQGSELNSDPSHGLPACTSLQLPLPFNGCNHGRSLKTLIQAPKFNCKLHTDCQPVPPFNCLRSKVIKLKHQTSVMRRRSQKLIQEWSEADGWVMSLQKRRAGLARALDLKEAKMKALTNEIAGIKAQLSALAEQQITAQTQQKIAEDELKTFSIIHISSEEEITTLSDMGLNGIKLSLADCSTLDLIPVCEKYGFEVAPNV